MRLVNLREASGTRSAESSKCARTTMDVVVLAGGFGTRLRPWTNSIPKPLLPILDQSMIEHVLNVLPESEVDKVLIAAGYGIDQMRDYFSNIDLPYEVVIVEETEPLGTGGAIANCRPHLSDGTFCVINGDLITSLKVKDMLEFHKKNGGLGTISLWPVEDPSRFGVADYIGETGKIMRFQEKPPIEEAFSNLINAGTYLLEPEIFDYMPEGRHSMERDVYEKIAENGVLNGFPFEGMFVDAGTPESFVEATQACINSGRFSTGETKDSTWFGNNVVNSGKIISSSVGRNSRVGNGTIVENSVILEGVKIGENCSIRNCLIGNNCIIHDGTSLDGIILDHGITVE